MRPFPLDLGPPGRRLTSSVQDRAPARLMAIVGEHLFRGHARYTPRDVTGDDRPETWCNLFAQDVCEAMGVGLPRYRRANELFEWLGGGGGALAGWEKATAHVAQAMAEQGQLALAAWHSVGPTSGHIAVVVPSLGEPGTWIAQAGLTNFTRGELAAGFGARPVTFFVHP